VTSLQPGGMLFFLTVLSIALGFCVLLLAVLVPREEHVVSSESEPVNGGPVAAATADVTAPVTLAAPLPPSFAGAVAAAQRHIQSKLPSPRDDRSVVPITEARRPLESLLPPLQVTWPVLVDETAINVDIATRLRLIEALGLIGGSWSREILARAYEQELDANVRGAIFVALRDSRSAA